MIEKYIPDISNYYLPPRKLNQENDKGDGKLIGLRLPESYYSKLEKISELEKREITPIVRAFVMSLLDKIEID